MNMNQEEANKKELSSEVSALEALDAVLRGEDLVEDPPEVAKLVPAASPLALKAEETSKPNMIIKLKGIMGKLATMICNPKEGHAKDKASTTYNDSMGKVSELHGNFASKIKVIGDEASAKYVHHVEPKVKKVQEIHANVTSKLKEVGDKTSASYNDTVAPHVNKFSRAASATFNEKVVPSAKKVGDKAATTFVETVVPKVKERASKLKEIAEPKLKETKVHASTKCIEFSDKVVAAAYTPKVKEVHENFKESRVGKKLQKTYDVWAYDDQGVLEIKHFKDFFGHMASVVCSDLAITVKSFSSEVLQKEAMAAEVPNEGEATPAATDEIVGA